MDSVGVRGCQGTLALCKRRASLLRADHQGVYARQSQYPVSWQGLALLYKDTAAFSVLPPAAPMETTLLAGIVGSWHGCGNT